MPQGAIIITTLDGGVVSLSQGAESIYGWPALEARGQMFDALVPADQHAAMKAVLAQVAAGTCVEDLPTVHQNRAGQRLAMGLSAFPLRDISGHVERMLMVLDVVPTRADEADQRLAAFHDPAVSAESDERLRRANEQARLAEMAGVIAHEVRNPLAGVRAAIEMVSRRLPIGGTETPVIDEVLARIDSLDALIDELLLFSETPDPHFAAVDLLELIDDIARSLSRRHTSEVEINAPGPVTPVWGDEALLRVVFQNLLINAAQAMRNGGTAEVSVRSDGSMVAVTIADDGPGFSARARAELFRPFFTTKARGTGLGLPMARRLVTLHGGSLDVDDSPAHGARVTVRLPKASSH